MEPRHLDWRGRPRLTAAPFYDRSLALASVALISLGILMVASTSIVISEQHFGQPFHYLIRSVLFLLIGLVTSIVILRTPLQRWYRWGPTLFLMSMGLLILVLIPGLGHSVNGSTRWLGYGPIRVQVSELAKLAMIVYLAGYIERQKSVIQLNIGAFVRPMFLVMMVAGLLLLEPDFGAAVVMVLTSIGTLYLARARLLPLIIMIGLALSAFVILAITSPYRMARLTSFLNPWANQFDSGYQLTQSLIAFGRGGWIGVGLGESLQKLFYLPEAHTDFLLAILAEELGLIGVLVVVVLFCIVTARALWIGRKAIVQGFIFNGYVAYGLGLWLGLQALVNIGVNAGLLPTKGLTLPLLSYGGSSLIINCWVIALLLRIDYENRKSL